MKASIILLLLLLCLSCREEFKGGRTFVIDEKTSEIDTTVLDKRTLNKLDSLNKANNISFDSLNHIKVGGKVESK